MNESIRPVCVSTKTRDRLLEALKELMRGGHGFETIIVDSVTELDTIFCQHIVDNDPKNPTSIKTAHGGWGAGAGAVAAMHENFRQALYKIHVTQGVNVVFIAHSDTERMDLPDKDPYMRYSCLLYTSPSPRDGLLSRMPSSA